MAVTAEADYHLNSQRIIQIISDPDFYAACVAFLYMQEMAHQRYIQYEAEVIRVQSKGCSGCEDRSRSLIEPALAEFVQQVQRLTKAKNGLAPLREYLVKKLGYSPTAFTIYYRRQRRPVKLTF
jgi:hypothetical protein